MYYESELYHHGIKGQKWGKQNGPPYPLSRQEKRKQKDFNKLNKATNKLKTSAEKRQASITDLVMPNGEHIEGVSARYDKQTLRNGKKVDSLVEKFSKKYSNVSATATIQKSGKVWTDVYLEDLKNKTR